MKRGSTEAMKMAAAMNSACVQIPCNLKISTLKSRPFTWSKTTVPRRFVLHCSHRVVSRGWCCGGKFFDSACVDSRLISDLGISRRCVIAYSDQKKQASNSTSEATGCQPSDDANGDDTAFYDNSSATTSGVTLRSTDVASSLRTVALCVFSAVAFGVGLGFKDGVGKSSEFFAGYLLEQSLSVDNLFVFVLIFKYFKVPMAYQNRVLSYGIAGAIIFRLSLILLGTATLQKYEVVNLLLATILLYSSFKLFFTEDDEDTDLSDNFIVKTCRKFIPVTTNYDGDRFFTTQNGVWKATPLLLTVAVIEVSDIAFAVDSIPAVFGVTRDPFIVFSSNLFAILGLRSYYTLISQSMGDLEYLQPAIGVVLGFIGSKMILDFSGFHIPTEVSLGLVATALLGGVALSLIKKSA